MFSRDRAGAGPGAGRGQASRKQKQSLPDYNHDKQRLKDFLVGFSGDSYKYRGLMQRVADREISVVPVSLEDVRLFFRDTEDSAMTDRFEHNALRYFQMLCSAVQESLPDPSPLAPKREPDVIDVLTLHRDARHEQQQQQQQQDAQMAPPDGDRGDAPAAPAAPAAFPAPAAYPQELSRRFEVHITPRADVRQVPLRAVRACHLGKLVVIQGIVTRASEVKPLAKVVTYSCDQCGCEVYQEIPGRTFMPLDRCSSEVCKKNASPGILFMQTRGSKFVKFQEIRIQEPMEQVPIGHIPRCINVRLQGELTHRCTPGDIVTIAGVFLPAVRSAGRGGGGDAGGAVADTFVEALSIVHTNKSYAAIVVDQQTSALVEASRGRDIYTRVANSIAPEIWGMEDVKKSLLLQMVGAPTRVLPDGMKIRGDINILLLGDPGVAKSQLLKHVSKLAPRSVYTSGKGSTGVGLMAAVVRDQTTGEFILEGGSLVLADMGICCIDEFDKMEETDRTAIHEVMEQQTISIAKAGITTTLNARTAVLAAANPTAGRYLLSRPPSENVGMPAALLSRFDLLFILLDTPELMADRARAEHIIAIHMNAGKPRGDAASDSEAGSDLESGPFSPDFVRAYIAKAREFSPVVPKTASEYVVRAYVNMRKEEKSNPGEGHSYTSARTLLGILRLSLALARLRWSNGVTEGDINEAMRLMAASKAAIARKPRGQHSDITDAKSSIFQVIRDHGIAEETADVPYDAVLKQILIRGFTEQELRETIAEYEKLGVVELSTDALTVRLNVQPQTPRTKKK